MKDVGSAPCNVMTDVSLSLSFQAMSQALIQYEGHFEAATAVVTHANVLMYPRAGRLLYEMHLLISCLSP